MEYKVAGLMSGTSGDGLDVALCSFSCHEGIWNFQIRYAVTVPFPDDIRMMIFDAHRVQGADLIKYDIAFGAWCGNMARKICREQQFEPLLVASHGHTVFHAPEKGLTLQIGHGGTLASQCGFPVVYDFRSADVAKGGQGAPLVPVGDHLLFPGFSACLNIGGIANISFEKDHSRVAYDVVPVNMVLNALSRRVQLPFDAGGSVAASGALIPELLEKLNNLPYFSQPLPKSLAREWVEKEVFPLLKADYPVGDLLHTYSVHAAQQIAGTVNNQSVTNVLITGGGAYNTFLINQISLLTDTKLILPDPEVIEFKEAMVFAFLGLLRWLGEINIYKTVTGATDDHCAGSVVLP